MNRNDAIKHFEPYLDNECYTDKHRQAVKMAIDALREQEDHAHPEPLTVEELCQMEGEPVWVQNLKVGKAFWMLAYKDCVSHRWGYLRYLDYGEAWVAYRTKWEEVQE